jgi:asparagine synthase (glutamine-hydrolysing)
MCGIAGTYGFSDHTILDQFSRDLTHRGPDGEGKYQDDTVGLLNRRLAIIDREGGDQPIYNEDRSLVVVFNGEIYNHRSLREELTAKGHTFATVSDTEVIVHAYEEWGVDAFDRFDGMFAFALYDKTRHKLTLARDQFGIKPLYFAPVDKHFMFSSEIIPLLNTGLIPRKVNDRILYRYLKYRVHEDNRDTFFEGIYRLLPGEMLSIDITGYGLRSYSSLSKQLLSQEIIEPENDTVVKETFHSLLKQAVSERLVSEVPVGTALSGGIDSSTIVSLVHSLMKDDSSQTTAVGARQKTFSAVFPGAVNDEEKYIDHLSHTLPESDNHKVIPIAKTFRLDLHDFVRTQEEPTISTGPYAQYQVMNLAKEHVTVLLDGQGADEMLAGYLPYYAVYFTQLLKQRSFLTLISEMWHSRDVVMKFTRMKIEQWTKSAHIIKPESLLSDEFVRSHQGEQFEPIKADLKARLHEDIFKNSLQSLLRYEDRNTMRVSLEGRVPFLDKELIRYIFSLPDRFIIRSGWNKWILRQSMKGKLPDKIRLRRGKIGFTTPEEAWFLELKKDMYEIFLSESFATRPYWDQNSVLKAFRLFLQGRNDDTMMFWRLLNAELWMREFIDEPKEQEDESASDHSEKTKNTTFQLGNPNEGKHIEIEFDKKKYARVPIRTKRFAKGDEYPQKIADHVFQAVTSLSSHPEVKPKDPKENWILPPPNRRVRMTMSQNGM